MPAPAARSAVRAVAVLDFLAARAGRAFTLSELAVEVGASPSSLTSVLQALTESGYLVRHPRHKTYELGPALVVVGKAAGVRHPVVELARPELAELARRFDADCVGSVLAGEDILILAVEGLGSRGTRGLSEGMRVPLVPPFGEVWMAYSEPAAVHRWMSRALVRAREDAGDDDRPEAGDDDVAAIERRLGHALQQVRARGYAVNLAVDQLDAIHAAAADRSLRPDVARRRLVAIAASMDAYELLGDRSDLTHHPEMIIAPVFGPDATVVFAITLTGLKPATGSEIHEMAVSVVEAGLRLTRSIGGHPPAVTEADRAVS